MKKASSVIATSVQMPAPLTYSTSRTSESSAAAGIEPMPARQLPGLAVDLAGELAEGDDRAGEGHRADEHAEEDLDPQDRDLDAGSCAPAPRQSRSACCRAASSRASTRASSRSALKPMNTAARPTKECSAATSCGISVICNRLGHIPADARSRSPASSAR